MTVLTRDEILTIIDLPITPVDVPEWGGQVFVRPLTAKEREVFESFFQKDADEFGSHRARLVAMAACDENGQNLFTMQDAVALSGKSGTAIGRIFTAAQNVTYPSLEEQEARAKK